MRVRTGLKKGDSFCIRRRDAKPCKSRKVEVLNVLRSVQSDEIVLRINGVGREAFFRRLFAQAVPEETGLRIYFWERECSTDSSAIFEGFIPVRQKEVGTPRHKE